MSSARYTAEFKAEAVKQVTERGHGVVEVAKRLGISDKSLYVWLKKVSNNPRLLPKMKYSRLKPSSVA